MNPVIRTDSRQDCQLRKDRVPDFYLSRRFVPQGVRWKFRFASTELRIFLAMMSLTSVACASDFTGGYLRHPPGTEYESVFIPCGTKEVWKIEGGPAYKRLVDAYNKTPHEQYGEVPMTLSLRVTRIDKSENLQEHSPATATVHRVIKVGHGVACKK